MRRVAPGRWAAFAAMLGCSQGHPPPRTPDEARARIRCPSGTAVEWGRDTHGALVSCAFADGTLHGPAYAYVDGGCSRGSFRRGVQVGVWQQWSGRGALLGRFDLGADGTGVETRWYDDGTLEWRGPWVKGKRHGTWTYWRGGAVSMVEEWERGRVARSEGAHWPSEIDEVDACPELDAATADDEDGCPEARDEAPADGSEAAARGR